jgi:methylmalonyl-CoA mutase
MNTAKGDSTLGTVDVEELDANAPPEPEELELAAEFPTPERDAWLKLVEGVVDGGVEKLVWTTPDGIRVRPLYTADDAPEGSPSGRAFRSAESVPGGWDVRQRHAEPDPEAARRSIAADLENGVTSIWLAVGEGGTAVADLPAALAGVHLEKAPVVLDAGPAAQEAAEAFLAFAGERGVAAADLLGTLGLDPLGLRARTGEGPDVDAVVPLARRVAAEFPRVRAVVVDAMPVHGAGASDAQELGWSFAAAVAYLRVLVDAGLDLAAAARLIEFRYAATVEQFPTIAKLRAARRLWSRVTEACRVSSSDQFQHAVASPVVLTRRDPYGNLLRGTVAGFAAGVGGADAVTVAPFDAALGTSSPFSRRIARNTSTLLVDESHLARVIDPAGGSWFVETLTTELARAAWAFFQEIEAAGGARAALDSGLVAERVGEVRERRMRDLATRRTPITGVSEFADLSDERDSRRIGSDESPTRRGGLPVFRLAEPYEAYRDRSDARLAETGARPRAFLATLGPLATYTARAGFARSLLAGGGIEAPEAGPTDSIEELVAAFSEAGTPVAVLCSSDALYAERGEAAVAALRAAGARYVLLAGRMEVAGVDGRLYAGCDALAAMDAVYEALEAAR